MIFFLAELVWLQIADDLSGVEKPRLFGSWEAGCGWRNIDYHRMDKKNGDFP